MKELNMRELMDKLEENEELSEAKKYPNQTAMIRDMMTDLVDVHMECEAEHGPDDEITLQLEELARKYLAAEVIGSRTR